MICGSFSERQVAPVGSSADLRGSVRHRRGPELLPDRLHPAGQRELRAAADLAGTNGEGHLQVHGPLHHGLPRIHDRHVHPLLLLSGGKG